MALPNQLVTSTAFAQFWKNLNAELTEMKQPPKSVEYTLEPTGWVGDTAPYTYELAVSGVTSNNVIIISLANSMTMETYDAQYSINTDADIRRVVQSDGLLTFYAYGTKPEVALQYDISVL